MLGRRGGYTRVDGPEPLVKAAGKYVVIDASNARGGQAAAAARMTRKMSRRRAVNNSCLRRIFAVR
jgi:hypothetical protein